MSSRESIIEVAEKSDRPVLIAERLRAVDGLIGEIEAIFQPQPATGSERRS